MYRGLRNALHRCWLHAIFAALLSLEPLTSFLVELKVKGDSVGKNIPGLIGALSNLFTIWKTQSNKSFHTNLRKAEDVTVPFIFKLGLPDNDYDVIDGFQKILAHIQEEFISSEFLIRQIFGKTVIPPKWIEIGYSDTNKIVIPITDFKPDFIICYALEREKFSLKMFEMFTHYKLHSLISFQNLTEKINHFSVVGFSYNTNDDTLPDGYWIMDDALNIKPGNYQGGFVSQDCSYYKENISYFFNDVPICIMLPKEKSCCYLTKNEY